VGIAELLKQRFLEKRGRDAALLYITCKHGNNKVGNVLELISETSFLWVSLNFWQKFMVDFIPALFLHSLLSTQLACYKLRRRFNPVQRSSQSPCAPRMCAEPWRFP